jgi:hypothetical protein
VKRQALVVAGLLLLSGCPKKDEPPEFDPNDRLLQKMKEEQARLAKTQPRPSAEPDPLAQIIASPSKPENLGIPVGVAADLGPVSLTLLEVQQSQTVGGGKVSLATTERFLKVTLGAAATKEIDLDLSGATLAVEEESVHLARDAQRAGKGSSLVTHLDKGEQTQLVLFFEAPDEMMRKGLKIILTTPESRVELPLQ